MVEAREHQSSELLEIPQVLSKVYENLKTSSRVVKRFPRDYFDWATYSDGPSTLSVHFQAEAFIAEVGDQEGVVAAFGDLRARPEFGGFNTGVILARLYTGERSKTAHNGAAWEYSFYGQNESSWDDVSLRHLEAVLPGRFINKMEGTASVYSKRDRLFLEGKEVLDYIAKLPTVSEKLREGTGLLSGITFIEENSTPYQSLVGRIIPVITQSAQYNPEVVNHITQKLQASIGWL